MNKKLGVFGDSFADPVISMWQDDDYELYETVKTFNNNVFKTWMYILDADTYGHGGTDVYYSFLKFMEHHEQYDNVIFIVTNSNNRISFYHDYHEEDPREHLFLVYFN